MPKKQAVVVIHGIGEQRPAETLRNFVKSILRDKTKYWNKPDSISGLFELRRFTAKSTSSAPITDFYEYYWAHRIRDTRFRHLLGWFLKLLFRKPNNVPQKILPIWIIAWLLLVISIILFLTGLMPVFLPEQDANTSSLISSAITFLILFVFKYFTLQYVGDAARYLDPSPDNVVHCQKIREEGVKLLDKLHKTKKYSRIVIVGHSLGSVIAYDIIKQLWVKYNTLHNKPSDISQESLKRLEKIGMNLKSLKKPPSPEEIEDYHAAQIDLWQEQRKYGNPWLITDLITLGSPLAYAKLLLACSEEEFTNRKDQRELPTCPPVNEKNAFSYNLQPYDTDEGKRTLRVLNHAALFACTCWTNLYFPGDIVGGPLQEVFGNGILDKPVFVEGFRWKSYLPFSHTWYWKKESAIECLRRSMKLDSKSLLRDI